MAEASAGSKREISESNQRRKARHRPAPHLHSRTADTARACGAPVRQEDLEPILNNLPLGKSPGPDRLPNKFYKTFSAVLSEILTGVFNEAKTNGKLPGSCTQGLISILYKKGPRDDPTNYRPITLLNGDYKILTRLIGTPSETSPVLGM